MNIGLVNYGSGNYGSVSNSLKYLGISFREISNQEDFKNISHIVLPGVGAFGEVMSKLSKLDLIEPMIDSVKSKGNYFLGICVGMQILADKGTELGSHKGLGLIPGEVSKINVSINNLRLPHIGWNDVKVRKNPIFKDINTTESFYFLHSFEFICKNSENLIASCEYGKEICAAVHEDNIFGVQFHPEKSQTEGLKVLTNFCELN